MPRTKISEFSATPASNTDIDSINISEGCAPSGINDAIRELMAQLKDFQTGAVGDSFNGPVGTTTAAAGAFTTLSASSTVTLSGGTANGVAYLNGSKVVTSGSALVFDGTNLGVGTSSPVGKIHAVASSAGATSLLERSTASTAVPVFASRSLATSSGDMADGFGPTHAFAIQDTAAVINPISEIGAVREGADNSGGLVFRTYSAGTATTQMRLDKAGNLGLGVTPSAWGSAYKALQFGTTGVLFAESGDAAVYLTSNSFINSAGTDTYITTDFASRYNQENGVHKWLIAPSGTAGNAITFTQAMTLDASGNLQLGTTTAKTTTWSGSGNGMTIGGASAPGLAVWDTTDASYIGYIYQANSDTAIGNNATGNLTFATGNTERARIDSSGNLLVGTTTPSVSSSVNGFVASSNGEIQAYRSGSTVAFFNRNTNDGTIVSLRQADTEEGSISVSGTTVSYNGGHLSRWAQMLTKPELFKGTVMSNLDEMNVYTKDGQPVDNEQLNKVKISDIEGDVNVAGVFVNWNHDEAHNVDEINMAMTGDMIIRIAQGTTVVRGDLLMSAGDGTAKPQGDDIVRSKTIAKVTSNHVTCTYADGSYCVPCVLMAC